jgi:exodeoxyribonuclease VII large subunit
MNLFAPRKIFTVSEITAGVKACLERRVFRGLRGWRDFELAAAASGHLTLGSKTRALQIRCVCFRSKARFLKFRAEDGLQVVASGNLSVYEPRGDYQLIVDFMEPKGFGSLQLAFEQLKARLQAEGLFDAQRKKPLPMLPRCIGIVTSPTGAAIQDILRILRRRHENVRVLIYPARVQGQGAATEIAAGIRALNRLSEIDVMIVGRGGGSLSKTYGPSMKRLWRGPFLSRESPSSPQSVTKWILPSLILSPICGRLRLRPPPNWWFRKKTRCWNRSLSWRIDSNSRFSFGSASCVIRS